MDEKQIEEQFKEFLKYRHPDATHIEIGATRKIYGGASRQTFSLKINIVNATSKVSRNVILRRELESGIIDTKTRTEWDAYLAFFNTEIPVPELLWIEEDPKWMGTPFMVLEEITGCEDSLDLLRIPPYRSIRGKIGERFCEIMGTIPNMESALSFLANKMEKPEPDECWKRELDYWEADINKNEQEPHPITRAAIRKLRDNPPPPPRNVVPVHGDMRVGNFLYNVNGEIKAILDWEMNASWRSHGGSRLGSQSPLQLGRTRAYGVYAAP